MNVADDYPIQSTKYPWSKWADGKWHELRRGKSGDFTVPVESLRSQVLRKSRRNGWAATTRALPDGKTLAIRITKGKSEDATSD